jgi:hypothetical protein
MMRLVSGVDSPTNPPPEQENQDVVVRAFPIARASHPAIPKASRYSIPPNQEIACKISSDERREIHAVANSLGDRYVFRCEIGMRKGIPPRFIQADMEQGNRYEDVGY